MPSRQTLIISDPVLNNFSTAFWQERDVTTSGMAFGMTGKFIATPVPTRGMQQFKYYTYNIKNRFQAPPSLRSPQTEYERIMWDVSSATDNVDDRGYMHDWDDTEADIQTTPVDLNIDSAEIVTDALLLDFDSRVNTLVTTAANFTNDSTAAALTNGAGFAWDNASSDPIQDAWEMINIVYKASGVKPNAAVMGWDVWVSGIAYNDAIQAQLNAANVMAGVDQVTPAMVGSLMGVDLKVNTTLKDSNAEGQATASLTVDFGKNVVFFYRSTNQRPKSRAFARTFEKRGLETRRWSQREKKRNAVDVSHEVKSKLTGELFGYLLTSVVS